MVVGSRTTLTDVQALTLAARTALDAALDHLGEAERAAYWASVTKCFNAPYQEDGHRRRAAADAPDIPGLAALAAADTVLREQPTP